MNLFIFEDAVQVVREGQEPPEMPVGEGDMPSCEELLGAAIQEGLMVKACRVCWRERGGG